MREREKINMNNTTYKASDIVILSEDDIRSYQMQVLDIARDVIAFFDDNNIEYSLSGGSILGAVRHEGFIPWDDDIDINIPRASYDKMIEIFDDYLSDKYYIQTPQKYPELGLLVVQIRKKGTIARRKYDWNLDECGVSIDLYIIENVFDNVVKRMFQKNISMALSFVVSSIRFCNNMCLPREIQELEGRQFKYSKLKSIFGTIFKVIPLRKWIGWADYWYSACKDTSTRLVAIPTGRKHFSGEIYLREDMCVFRKANFEGEQFNIPIKAEKYLEYFYGDYMSIPPKEKREKHIFLELKY